MATQASLAIRRDEAYARIIAATKKLAKGVDASQSNAAEIRHRDPAQEQIMRLEEVADTLEALAKAHGKSAKDNAALQDELETTKAELESAQAELEVFRAKAPPVPDSAVGTATVETVQEVPADEAKAKK